MHALRHVRFAIAREVSGRMQPGAVGAGCLTLTRQSRMAYYARYTSCRQMHKLWKLCRCLPARYPAPSVESENRR